MANSIALAEQYLPLLDEVYKAESKTAILDAANTQVKFNGGNKVEIFKTSMDGLGNYSRATGFPAGDVTGTWEQHTLSQDRGRSFNIDAMDDEETLGLAFGTLAGEFMRTKVIPEVDCYRFAKLATAAANKPSGAITDAVAELDTAAQVMGDAEVPAEGRILFVSESFYKALKGKITRYLANENGVNRQVETYDGMPVIRVPQGRFNDAVQIGTNGFTPNGNAIDFMIVHPSAVIQVVKHEVPRIFSPDVNQAADAWKFDYRLYHDEFVMDNKTTGIYVHTA